MLMIPPIKFFFFWLESTAVPPPNSWQVDESRGLWNKKNYIFCNLPLRSISHLFFRCTFTVNIWRHLVEAHVGIHFEMFSWWCLRELGLRRGECLSLSLCRVYCPLDFMESELILKVSTIYCTRWWPIFFFFLSLTIYLCLRGLWMNKSVKIGLHLLDGEYLYKIGSRLIYVGSWELRTNDISCPFVGCWYLGILYVMKLWLSKEYLVLCRGPACG